MNRTALPPMLHVRQLGLTCTPSVPQAAPACTAAGRLTAARGLAALLLLALLLLPLLQHIFPGVQAI